VEYRTATAPHTHANGVHLSPLALQKTSHTEMQHTTMPHREVQQQRERESERRGTQHIMRSLAGATAAPGTRTDRRDSGARPGALVIAFRSRCSSSSAGTPTRCSAPISAMRLPEARSVASTRSFRPCRCSVGSGSSTGGLSVRAALAETHTKDDSSGDDPMRSSIPSSSPISSSSPIPRRSHSRAKLVRNSLTCRLRMSALSLMSSSFRLRHRSNRPARVAAARRLWSSRSWLRNLHSARPAAAQRHSQRWDAVGSEWEP